MLQRKTLRGAPTVCAIEKTYCIVFLCSRSALASVTVGEQTYTDNINGVLRSDTPVHKVYVPATALDTARHYTVRIAPLESHAPYFAKPEPTETYEYDFTPVMPGRPVRLYVLSDTHGNTTDATAAALAAGHIDALVTLGDMDNAADTPEQVETLHRLTSAITQGRFPVVCARGNHDTRGKMAEHLGDYLPTRGSATYYTFRLGDVWGLVLDAGEDKPDDHAEYGGVNDFPGFRRAQTAYMKDIIARATETYAAEGVRHRIVLCHINFALSGRAFAQTTPDIYADWVGCLNEMGIHAMLCGHSHMIGILPNAGYTGTATAPDLRAAFPVIHCSALFHHPVPMSRNGEHPGYTGAAIRLDEAGITPTFINGLGEEVPFDTHDISLLKG